MENKYAHLLEDCSNEIELQVMKELIAKWEAKDADDERYLISAIERAKNGDSLGLESGLNMDGLLCQEYSADHYVSPIVSEPYIVDNAFRKKEFINAAKERELRRHEAKMTRIAATELSDINFISKENSGRMYYMFRYK